MAALVTHLLVRWLHVISVAVLLGGSVLAWAALRAADGESGRADLDESVVRTLAAFEWLFWAAFGVVVLAGVGTLGALAPGVPGPATDWGGTLAVKLGLVLALLGISLVRTLAVVRARTAGTAIRPGRIRAAYAVTTAALLLVVALAEVLAHG